MEASIQLYDLIITPFSILNNEISSGICPQSKYSHYWGMLKDFEYKKVEILTYYQKWLYD